jgi:CRP-like cAMP-binding protein
MALDLFFQYLSKYVELTTEDKQLMTDLLPPSTYSKGDHLLVEGEVSNAFFFMHKGLCRMYYLVDGVEKNTFFYQEQQFVSSYESFVHQHPSKHFIQCLEDCELIAISTDSAFRLLSHNSKFERLSRILMEEELILYQKMLFTYVAMNAEQRYTDFVKEYPDLLQRIPQYHIASYLGVNAETLSRIRKRISNK